MILKKEFAPYLASAKYEYEGKPGNTNDSSLESQANLPSPKSNKKQ